MLHRSFKPAKCKTSLKLATSRIKLLKNKKASQVLQMKRELAKLIESGQIQTARIRVEHVVREEKIMAAYDLVEIYCEIITARLPIIESQKNCPIDLKESITSVIFASPRCSDIPELLDIRKHFTAKYGKEFISSAVELYPECGVSRTLVEKLSAVTPDVQTKLKILTTIAEEHNIKWDPTFFEEKFSTPSEDLLNGSNIFNKASQTQARPLDIQSLSHYPMHNVSPEPYVPKPDASSSLNTISTHIDKLSHDERSFQGESSLHSERSSHNERPSAGFQHVVPTEMYSNNATLHSKFNHEVQSGMGSNDKEFSQVSSRERNEYSPNKRHNWNMEFKDATSAAQIAVECAERASLAAKAATELSAHESILRQYKKELEESSIHNLSDDQISKSLSHKFSRGETNGNGTTFKSNAAFMDKDLSANSFQKTNKYPRRGSFEVESREQEGNIFDDVSRKEQSGKYEIESQDESVDHISEARKMKQSSTVRIFGTDHDANLDNQDYGYIATSKGDFQTGIKHTDSYDNAFAVFDDSVSDEDDYKLVFDHGHTTQEAYSFSSSPEQISPNQFSINSTAWSTGRNENKPVGDCSSQSHFPTESHSPSRFPVSAEKSPVTSEREDFLPLAFDDSDGANSESDADIDKSKSIGKMRLLCTEQNSNDEVKHSRSMQSSRLSATRELEDNDAVQQIESSDIMQDIGFSDVGENGLKFGTLTGGFRNKGYRHPPYVASPSNKASPLFKNMDKDNLISSVESTNTEASNQEPRNSKASPKINRKCSSRDPAPYFESNDSAEELHSQELLKKTSHSGAPIKYFDSEDSGDIPKQAFARKSRFGSGYSQRTKASLDSERDFKSNVAFAPEILEKKHSSGYSREEGSAKKDEKEQHIPLTKIVTTGRTESLNTSNVGTPQSSRKVSHVHPKLPDFDKISAQLECIRLDRK